jgi:hypothetical protein
MSVESIYFLDIANKINIFATIPIICIGLIGNTLSLIIYSQSKYRLNSSNVFILILSIVDSLFLIVHFFEDTINSLEQYKVISIHFLNIIDTNREICILTNYLRYTLRSISSYIILAFTIQRYSVVYSPLSSRFKSKKYAWCICLIIIVSLLVINSWSLFVFDLTTINQTNDKNKQCDIIDEWINIYYYISINYFTFTKLIPMICIIVLNFLIVYKSKNDDLKRKQYVNVNLNCTLKRSINMRRNALKCTNQIQLKNKNNRLNNSLSSSTKMTKTLVSISFSYVILNFPYTIMWYVYIFRYK